MPELTINADCPRCGKKEITFEPKGSNDISVVSKHSMEDKIQNFPPDPYRGMYELFAICRGCKKATVFIIGDYYDHQRDDFPNINPMTLKGSLNKYFEIVELLRVPYNESRSPPEFLPPNIEQTFKEGAACLSIECWNAAGGMFRKCLDLTAKDKLKKKDHGKKLSTKIKCLLAEKILSADLEKVANYIILDGNDGLHNRMLTKDEAMILVDFTVLLLGRIYTEPEIIKQIEKRREKIKTKIADEAKQAKQAKQAKK